MAAAGRGRRGAGDPALLGRGDQPTTLVAAPGLGTIPAGERRTYRIPVSLPAPSFGTYTVRGELAGAAFLAETTTYPWGITGAFASLVVVMLVLRLRGARRVTRRPTAQSSVSRPSLARVGAP